MRLLEKGIDTVESLMEFLARHMIGRDLSNYCDLVTAIGISDDDLREFPDIRDPHILVTKDNALVTVFDVQGTFSLMSDQEFGTIVENLRMKLGSYMRTYGHSMSFVLECDPDRSYDELMRLAEPQINTAKRIGLDAVDIILSRVERNAPLVAWEQNLLVVYTHMTAMAPEEQKRVLAERADQAKSSNLPLMKYGQNPASVLAALKHRHDSFVERIRDDFLKSGPGGQSGILVTRLSAHDVGRIARIQLNRENTSQKWRPRLPGDKVLAGGAANADDYSDVTHPKLNYQICAQYIDTDEDFIVTDDLYHTAISLELGPLEPQPFRALKEKMNRTLPWRIRFDIEPGGLDKTRGRRTLLSFTAMFPGNTIIRDSFNELVEMDKDDPACTMRVVAATWGKTKAQAKERRSALTKALQSWGVCQTRVEHGDPVEAFGSTIAAFSTSNAGTMMFPPLGDALEMMPLQRPATPWASDGDFVQRTPEGKIYPIGLASRLQDVDIRAVAAEPGSGKSMMLGSMNFATSVRPGARRLPLITILDVGISGVSQVEMIQDSLPPSRRHEALAIRLTNSAEYAVNPFDTQLGADAPTRQEEDYLVDFLGCLLMNTQTLRPPSADCGRLALALIKNVYKEKLQQAPAPYERDVDPAIEACLDANGLREKRTDQWWADATWKEVRDLLFVEGHRREAGLAHSRAMPTLADFNAALLSKDIESIYGTARTDTSERLLDYAQRAFTAARDQFAIFAGRTRFELNSETRVLCLDLQSVIGSTTNEGRLRTQIMFLFGRHMAARNYFLDDKELQEVLPANKIYHEYHMARWADVKDEQKFIVYDELHNIGKPNAEFNPVYDRMEKDGRENRKWGVSVVASSQYLTDFPEKLLNAATSVYVMRGGAIENERVLRESFKVSDEAIRRLNLEATGPGPQGGNYLAIFKTKVGRIIQMLNNTPGPVELWAFTTTPDDMALRRRLYNAIGPSQARTLLAKRFKTGSAGSVINAMKRDIRADDAGNVIDKLAEELLEEYRRPTNDQPNRGAL